MAAIEEEELSRASDRHYLIAQGPHTFETDSPPQDFACTIQSFKQLSNIISESGVETYQSRSFNKGSYRWKLIIYPNGDTRNEGKDHISVYLALVDSTSFPVGLKVYATFSFYVFDQTQLRYSVFQGSKRHKFDKLKNGYGYPKLIPLSTFNDPSSGYLINDSCVFGVNVNVKLVQNNESKAKLERICNSGGSLIHTSFNFSQLDNEYYETKAFPAGGQQWVLRLYSGWVNGYGNHLSLYLRLSRPKSLVGRVTRYFKRKTHEKVHAKFTLRIIDQLHDKHVERTVCGVYSDSNRSWGCSDFMELCQLRDQSYGYIENDKLIAEVDFGAIFGTN